MKKILTLLVVLYGIFQMFHILMNIAVVFSGGRLLSLASPSMASGNISWLWISVGIDLLVASPLGVWGFFQFFSTKRDTSYKTLAWSLAFAIVSAAVYVGVLCIFDSFVLNTLQIIFGIFALVAVLLALTLLYRFATMQS
jgi:protein-S-isoprenylcysteine O-methyltransferase Ste14